MTHYMSSETLNPTNMTIPVTGGGGIGTALVSINEVDLCRAQFLLVWVTMSRVQFM